MKNKLTLTLCIAALVTGLGGSSQPRAQETGSYKMSAGSMKPTVQRDEIVAVVRYTAGSGPQPGDLVMFKLPKDGSIFLKRLVGLPGDRIQMIDGALHLNGQPVKRERIGDYTDTADDGRKTQVKRWQETLPNGVSYETLDFIDNGFLDNTAVHVVPPSHYFMLGDNRDHSNDSRMLSQFGTIPADNIVGRAVRPNR